MKFHLLLVSAAVADMLPSGIGTVASSTHLQPASCPKITCVMFCKNGIAKDDKGCDICSCAKTGGTVANINQSCNRDAHGCCAELGVQWCPDQNMCLSTLPNAVIKCKSWGNTLPVSAVRAPQTTLSASVTAVLPPAPQPVSQPRTIAAPAVQASLAAQTVVSANGGLGAQALLGPQSLAVPSSCPQVMCAMFCENGFQRDSKGCQTCSCAGGPNGACSPVQCGDRTCPGGFAKDSNGCATCVCPGGSISGTVTATSQTSTPAPAINPPAAANLCSPACGPAQKCVSVSVQCIRAPCPQLYQCVAAGKGKGKGKGGKKGKMFQSPPP